MASATLSLNDHAATPVVFSLVGNTSDGAIYRLTSRALALPLELKFQYKLGNPGSDGNDKVIVVISDSRRNTTTGKVSTGRLYMELSAPRDTTAWVDGSSEHLFAYIANLLTSANRAFLADAVTP